MKEKGKKCNGKGKHVYKCTSAFSDNPIDIRIYIHKYIDMFLFALFIDSLNDIIIIIIISIDMTIS